MPATRTIKHVEVAAGGGVSVDVLCDRGGRRGSKAAAAAAEHESPQQLAET